MKTALLIFTTAAAPGLLLAADTIDASARFAHGANTGWINFEGDATNGAVIGEYVASGFVYSANCGWIHLGDGTPADGIRYQNNSATDCGVNLVNYACPAPGVHTADLRGFAYGANIGWINFENTGNPRVDLGTGKLRGYAWSANTGWMNLGELNANVNVVTTTIRPGADSDGDDIADAYEYTHAGPGDLIRLIAYSDADGDGFSDTFKYQADTDPFDALDRLQVTSITRGGTATEYDITFTSKLSRVYQMETSETLLDMSWSDTGGPIKPGAPTGCN